MTKSFILTMLSSFMLCSQAWSQGKVTGKVHSSSNEGLPGVNVLINGTTVGTVTDANGDYSIDAPPSSTLVFSFIGYATQQIQSAGRTVINVLLLEEERGLSEVVVVGYGVQKKTDVTGALSVISTKEFSQQPVSRLHEVLQGRAAGVQVSQSNGSPGGDAKVRIRGANSVLGNNDPLYVVDGFVGANFNLLNPEDIETLQVLKDAASTSIYGSRGANGVVIITTKKGSKGIKVSYEGQGSVSNVIKTFDILPAGEFAEIVNARAIATGSNAPFTTDQVEAFKRNGGTDWQDLVYRTGRGQQHQVSVSGGGDKTKFLVSGNYVNQKGIVENSDFKRYLIRTNISTSVTKDLDFRLNMSAARSLNHNTDGGGALIEAMQWAPTTPAYGEDGFPTFNDPIGSVTRNPLDHLYDKSNNQIRTNLNMVGGLNYTLPIKGLSLDLQYAINFLDAQNKNVTGDRLSNRNPTASRYSSDQITLQNTNALNYAGIFGNHSVNAVAVLETQQFTDQNFTANATGLSFPQLGFDNIGANTASSVSSGFQKWTLLSLLGRVNYSFKEKYLVAASVRQDGSSKFSPANRKSVFPSVALGWRLSEEDFIKSLNVFHNLKLRGSWGMTGSQAINPYATLSAYGSTQVSFNNTAIKSGIILGNQGNGNLKWETTRQLDVGLEFELFSGRLRFEADYFNKTTTDLLLNVALPNYAGGGTQTRNIGEIENKGFEFSFGGDLISGKEFSWETNMNFSTLKNKVISLGEYPRLGMGTGAGGGMSITNEFMLMPGEPLGSYWGLKYLGTFKPADEEAAALQGRVPGDPRYEDLNGDNNITTDDFQIVGRAFPRFTGGWNNTFAYKGLTLNLFFQAVMGVDKLNYSRAGAMSGSGEARQFLLTEIRDFYRSGNETSDIPAFTTTYQPFTQSSRFIENGSFVRLKNISLNYDIAGNLFKDLGKVSLFLSATNLLTMTDYSGPDPESSNVGSGTDTAIGIDRGSYPNSKTYTLGIRLNF